MNPLFQADEGRTIGEPNPWSEPLRAEIDLPDYTPDGSDPERDPWRNIVHLSADEDEPICGEIAAVLIGAGLGLLFVLLKMTGVF